MRNTPQTNETAPLAHRIPAACARLGIGHSKLYALIASGEIRSIKVGARTLIPESELVAFIAKRMEAAA